MLGIAPLHSRRERFNEQLIAEVLSAWRRAEI
jgi:hypothetical protein